MATLPNLSNVADAISGGSFASKLASTTGGASSLTTALGGMSIPNTSSITSGITNLTGAGGLPNLNDLTSKIPKIPPGLPSLDLLNVAKPNLSSASSLLDATKGVSGSAFSAISDSFKPLKAGVPQNLTAINVQNKLEQAAADAKVAATPSADALKQGLNAAGVDLKTGAIPSVNAAIGAGGVGAGLDALGSAMKNVPGMGGVTSLNSSTIASGITNLPGGQSAAASLLNSTTNTTSGISDTLGGLNTITKNASSSALNNISSITAGTSAASNLLTGSQLTGAGANLAGGLTNPLNTTLPGIPSVDSLTKGLTKGKDPLASLATSGLSASGAAALAASMNSISTASPNPIKMPTIATATVDRSEVSSQVTNLLGDKKVPPPDFAKDGLTAANLNAIENRDKKRAEFFAAQKKYDEEYIVKKAALEVEKKKYIEFRENYPVGDPTREAARAEVNGKIAVFNAWREEQNALVTRLADEANKI
jgi:hypothetical protein